MNISINYYGFLQIIIAVIIIQTSEGQSGGFGFSSGFGESSSSGNGFGNMFGSSSGSDGGDDEDSCPPVPHDCDPKCIKYDEPHCRKCQCPSDGASNSPFNQGTSLYQTPYSSAISSMQVMTGTPYGSMGHNGISPMSWPGIFIHPGTSINGVQCIKGDIVCPQYCLVEDEYGCKSCPCGPANGMTPPITSGHVTHLHLQSPDEHKEPETKDCLGTIICIISCNEGYKLGPKDKDGCQSCSCTKQKHKDDESNSKKNNSSATGGSGDGDSGNESGTGSNSKTNSSPSPSGAGMPSPFSVGGGGDSGSGGDGSGFNPMFPGAGMGMSGGGSGMGMSGGGGSMGMGIGGGGGGGCVGPFCTMAGSSGGGGAGGGMSAMMGGGAGKSPFGGMGSGGPRMPISGSGSTSPMATGNKDCIGPACSAKNGKKLVEEITSTHAKTCPTTDMCVKTCKYNVKLGAIGSDGCPSCACEMIPATEAPQQQLCDEVVRCMLSCKTGYEIGASNEHGCASCSCKTPPTSAPVLQHSIAPAVSTRASCDEATLRCIHTCKYGYHLLSSSATECPVCRCLPPPTAAPTQKPNVYSILKSCPEAVHCMTTCNNGYTMETKPGDSCPRCKCNAVAVVQLHCAAALSCPLGCKVGYRCGDDGCPTCECIIPANVGVSHSTAYLQASVSCNPHFSCVSQCLHGYQSGDNGCPTCKCLQLITAAAVNPVHGSQHHETVSIASSQHTQHVVHQTWGFKDVLKNCPNVVTCVATCSNGIDIGGAPAGQCPKCSCKGVEPTRVPLSSHAGTLVGHIVQGSSNSHPGVHILPSPHPSVESGHSGTGSLPHTAVNSGEHVHPSIGAIHTSVVSGSAQHSSHSSVGMPSRPAGQPGLGGGSGGKITIGPMLTHGGTSSAVSEHHEDCIGPACSAKNGMHTDTKKLEKSKSQSPGQCVDIIRCVFSCHHGYKIGDKQKDGCPTCQCLD